ncbi:hypothetical protein CDD82_4258 [Ophiocordyceps australis]|uniref:alpha-1,2-Mannosidase n=1 Tax=Ophiocordyceps australis TaxID=1399860 RepID=A0A2C5ZLS6_9HYPO|nr:hypothetical protein CDD82_4258 [Ophiocordyceps australis]
MRFTNACLVLLEVAAGSAWGLPSREARQPEEYPQRAAAIVEAFNHSWTGYYRHAFPHDTLRPLSNGFEDDRAAWGVTVVDALSTAIVMQNPTIVNQMLDHIAKVDFSTTARPNDEISVFETNIRYLGGLLSGYDLLKGPMMNLVADQGRVDMLLRQAKSLGDTLSIAFDTPSGIPDPKLVLNPTKRISGSKRNNLAEVGTLILEWTRLSDALGDAKYAQLAERTQSYLLRPSGIPGPWPGLLGFTVSVDDGSFLDDIGGWSGGTDSFYEYLIKMYQYDPVAYGEYKDRWVAAADSTMQFLASHPTTRPGLTYLAQYHGQQKISSSSHLASFAGGNFILGGALLNENKYKAFGLALAESYFNNYAMEPVGIGPETFRWVDDKLSPDDDNNKPPPQNQEAFYKQAGFYNESPTYILRPETIESLYYAYRLTGDRKWQDMAWAAFERIQMACRAGSAYAELSDVTQPNSGAFFDEMQSFWMAETLKYLYLIFAPESEVQLQLQNGGVGSSRFVYNTEAHPLRVRGLAEKAR